MTVTFAAGAILLAGCSGPNLASMVGAAPKTSSEAVLPAGSLSGGTLSGGTGSGGTGSGGTGAGGTGSGGGTGFTFNPDCLGVASAYTSIAIALVPSLLGGNGTYDSAQVVQAISSLGGKVPDELKPDFQTLGAAAKAAAGKSIQDAGTILGADAVTAASDHISNWMDKNCGT